MKKHWKFFLLLGLALSTWVEFNISIIHHLIPTISDYPNNVPAPPDQLMQLWLYNPFLSDLILFLGGALIVAVGYLFYKD